MPDKTPEPRAQLWNRPGGSHPPQPAPSPAPPRLTPAGPLKGTDTIMVTRDGVPMAVPLSVVAAYVASAAAAAKAGHGS